MVSEGRVNCSLCKLHSSGWVWVLSEEEGGDGGDPSAVDPPRIKSLFLDTSTDTATLTKLVDTVAPQPTF